MKSTKRIFLISISFLGVIALIWGLLSRKEEEHIESRKNGLKIPVEGQHSENRVWQEIKVDTLVVIGDSKDEILFRPGIIKGDADGNSYIVDYGDVSIKKFDRKGRPVATFGRGRGEGPGEFVNPTDIAFDDKRTLWIADLPEHSLSWFLPDGTFLKKIKLEEGILRVAPVDSGYYYVMRVSPRNPRVFNVYALEDKFIRSFGDLIEDYRTAALSLDGHILSAERDLVYVPFYYGAILRYDINGSLIYARGTVEKGEPPKVETGSIDGNRFQRVVGRKTLNNCPSYDNGKLYLLAISASKAISATVIDVYLGADGTYQYSFKLPGFSVCASVVDDRVHTLQDTTAVVYRVRGIN